MTTPAWVRRRAARDAVAAPERTLREVLSGLGIEGLPRNEQVRAIREVEHWNGHGLGEDDVRLLREAGLLT